MPSNKKNRRKEVQKARREAESKPKRAIIAHAPHGASGAVLALAVARAFPEMVAVKILDKKEGD